MLLNRFGQMKFVVNFKLVLISLLLLTLQGCFENDEPSASPNVIKIAAIYSETGTLAYLGLSSKAALEIAIEEINSDFENRQIPYRFELQLYDTQLNPSLALEFMQQIAASGCKLVIGPLTSSELLEIKPYADSMGILVVSPSSTASSLSLPMDMIFRFAPGDQIVGQALANTMFDQGKRAMISISRNDTGSLSLRNSIGTNFSNLGGQFLNEGSFDGSTTDFSLILETVKNDILNLSSTYSLDQIGVVTTSFDETILLFEQASSDPVLSSVNWYGGVGFYKNPLLLNNSVAAQFALNTGFFSPGFSLPLSTQNQWTDLFSEIYEQSGYEGNALTLCSYDIMKVFGEMIELNHGIPNGNSALQLSFMNVANLHSGVTGLIQLNENGDRANAVFDYWGIVNNNGLFQWGFLGQSQ
jgi:branched-chain amino acid transport system substrate-binding protein